MLPSCLLLLQLLLRLVAPVGLAAQGALPPSPAAPQGLATPAKGEAAGGMGGHALLVPQVAGQLLSSAAPPMRSLLLLPNGLAPAAVAADDTPPHAAAPATWQLPPLRTTSMPQLLAMPAAPGAAAAAVGTGPAPVVTVLLGRLGGEGVVGATKASAAATRPRGSGELALRRPEMGMGAAPAAPAATGA